MVLGRISGRALDGDEKIRAPHVAEVIQYWSLSDGSTDDGERSRADERS